MAALGSIAAQSHQETYHKIVRAWTPPVTGIRAVGMDKATSSLRYRDATARSYVSGVVRENGVIAARLVRVYRRDNGDLLGETTSSAVDGTYQLNLGYTGYVFVIAFDATGAPVLNAAVVDYITPA